MIQAVLHRLLDGHDLSRDGAREAMDEVMRGEATPAQIGGFLAALRAKGETVEEIAGFAEAMAAHVLPVVPRRTDLVDTAARYSRWELMIGLVERGAPLPATGLTPLHLAAGAGEVAVVQALLDLGADPAATDPQFHATPRQWARFLGRRRVVELLS